MKNSNKVSHILLVSAIPPPSGGIATWTVTYREFCKKNNINLDIVNTAMRGTRGKRVNVKRNIFSECKRTGDIIRQYLNFIRNRRYDIIHINTSCGSLGIIRDYVLLLLARKRNNNVVIQYHCNIPDQVRNRLSRAFLKKIVNLAKLNVVLNNSSREYIEAYNMNLPICISPNFISSVEMVDHVEIRDKIKRVLFVGHVLPYKGCTEIIDTARVVKDVEFILVGPVDSAYRMIDLPKNVILCGAVDHDQIKQIMRTADVFMFPTYSEGFSLSLLEAMAAGLPIITTNVGANKDMIEDNGGVIVSCKDVEGLVAALDKISSYKIRKEMSTWNREKVKLCYLDDTVIDLLFEQYQLLRK